MFNIMKMLRISNLFKIIQNYAAITICCCLIQNNGNACNMQDNNSGINYFAQADIKQNNKKLVNITYNINVSITLPHFVIIEKENTYIYNNNSVLSYSKNKIVDANTKQSYDTEIRNKFNNLFKNIEKYLKEEACNVFGKDYNISIEQSSDKIYKNTKYFENNQKFINCFGIHNPVFPTNIVLFNKNNTYLYMKAGRFNNTDTISIFTNSR